MHPGLERTIGFSAAAILFSMPAGAGQATDPEGIEELFYRNGQAAYRCAEQLCKEAKDWEECLQQRCVGAKEDWSLAVTRVRYDGKTLSLEGKLGYKFSAGQVIDFAARKQPIWLGMTVTTQDGGVIDVPARQIPMAKIPGPFKLKAEVGPRAKTWTVAAWHMELKPCQVDRPGCKQHGHVLVGLLAWEPHCAYQCAMAADCGFGACMGGTPVLPGKGPVTIRVLDAGGGAGWAAKAVAAARKVLAPCAKRNGRKLAAQTKGKARAERPCLEVLYRDERNARRAAVVAQEVLQAGGFSEETEWGTEYPEHKVTHWDKAPADFVLAVGKGCGPQ